MSDGLTPLEADLIKAHVRDHGVTRCPPCTFTEDLVVIGSASKESKAASRRVQARQRKFQNAGKVGAPTPETARLIEMAKTMTTREIGVATGITSKAVARRLRRHGVEPLSDLAFRRIRRQEKVRVMMAEGLSAAEISSATGANQQTIYDDIKMLMDQGCPRKRPKSGPVVPGIGARREKVRKLRAEGLSLSEIGRRCKISVGAIRYDVKKIEAEENA